MNTIDVFIYGYKSKLLPESARSILENQSGNYQINIKVYDQINLNRNEKFSNISYTHIFWDDVRSKFLVLENEIKQSNAEYFLFIDGATIFQKNWDMELVMGHGGNNVIFSGRHKINFNKNNIYKFYSEYTRSDLSSTEITNWIVKDFVFMKTELFKQFPSISRLKYRGYEEVYSFYAAGKNIPIFAIATAWAENHEVPIDSFDYLPFSINSGYNELIDNIKGNNEIFLKNLDGVKNLSEFHSYDFTLLSKVPFIQNDIEYDPRMDLDNMDGERFHNVIKSIY